MQPNSVVGENIWNAGARFARGIALFQEETATVKLQQASIKQKGDLEGKDNYCCDRLAVKTRS